MSIADQPAFPCQAVATGGTDRNGDPVYSNGEPGMTYRQWLVGMALQGYVSNPVVMETCLNSDKSIPGRLAALALEAADAAIRAQEKE